MVNAGFLNRASEIRKEAKEAMQASFSASEEIWKLNMQVEQPYDVLLLTDFFFDPSVHFLKGQQPTLCNKMYFDEEVIDCEDCKKPGFKGKGTNIPAHLFCTVGYVLNLVGSKKKSKDGTKEYDENPIKVIEIIPGRDEENHEELRTALAEGYFKWNPKEPNVWRIKRLAEGGIDKPRLLSAPELKKMAFPAVVPEEVLDRFSKKTQGEIIGYVLSCYGNQKREKLEEYGAIFPKKKEVVTEEKDDLDS